MFHAGNNNTILGTTNVVSLRARIHFSSVALLQKRFVSRRDLVILLSQIKLRQQ